MCVIREAAPPSDAAKLMGGGGKPQSAEDYFKPDNVQKTCKVCQTIANVNYEECIKPDENHDNKCCKHALNVLKSKFDAEWDKNPSNRRRSKNPTCDMCNCLTTFILSFPTEEGDDNELALEAGMAMKR